MSNNNHRIFTIADQLLLSILGFGTSAALVQLGNIEELGVYGAFLAVVTLVQTAYGSVVSGQMLLYISGKSIRLEDAFFRLTEFIWLFYAFAAIILTAVICVVMSFLSDASLSHTVFVAGLCVIAISLFEQHRKFLYIKKRFITSFSLTCVFFIIHIIVSYWFIANNSFHYSAKDAFLSLAIAYSVTALINPVTFKTVKHAKKINHKKTYLLHKRYLEQGKFAIGGLSLAWLQNQSISLYFLVIFGPTVAGLFNLGRLITMPIMVVNTGLINGVLPALRKLGVDGKLQKLSRTTNKYATLSLSLNLVYAAVIVIALQIDWVLNLQKDLSQASRFIYFWLMLTTLMVWRTWVTQFLIVNLKFKRLLKFNAISAFVTFSGFVVFTVLAYPPIVIAGVMIFGELVIYLMVKGEQKRILCQSDTS